MAFNTIPTSLIQVGKAVVKQLWQYTKDNFDDHETRINAVETGANKVIIFDDAVLNISTAASLTGVVKWRAPFAFTLLDAKVGIREVGSLTGTLEMNVRKSTTADETSTTSVFTTRPSVAYGTASDWDESTNVVFDNVQKNVSEGNYLYIDVSALPSGGTTAFNLYLIGEL